jgi:hypothetical protein
MAGAAGRDPERLGALVCRTFRFTVHSHAYRVWSVGYLIEAALKAVPTKPTPSPAQRRKGFRVIQGDLFE